MDVEGRRRLVFGVVLELMHGNGEDALVAFENGRGPVAVVNVAVHHHGGLDEAVGLQTTDGNGHVIDGTEALAMTGVRVMKTAAQVVAYAVAEGHASGKDAAARVQP